MGEVIHFARCCAGEDIAARCPYHKIGTPPDSLTPGNLEQFIIYVARTFLSAGYAGTFLSRVFPHERGDWKVAKTRRLESLRYIIIGNLRNEFPVPFSVSIRWFVYLACFAVYRVQFSLRPSGSVRFATFGGRVI